MSTSKVRRKEISSWSIMNARRRSKDVGNNSAWRKNSSNSKNKAKAQIGTPTMKKARRLTNKMKTSRHMISSPTTMSIRNTHLKKWTPSRKRWKRKASQLMRNTTEINSKNNLKRSVRRATGKAKLKKWKNSHRTKTSRNKKSQKERAVPPNSKAQLTVAKI
jgi:hypothetical protein